MATAHIENTMPLAAAMMRDIIITARGRLVSSSPMNNIQSIRVFTLDDMRLCRGLLIRYTNGGMYALGQCSPLHKARSYVVESPTSLWYRQVKTDRTMDLRHLEVAINAPRAETFHEAGGEWTVCMIDRDKKLIFIYDGYGEIPMIYTVEELESASSGPLSIQAL